MKHITLTGAICLLFIGGSGVAQDAAPQKTPEPWPEFTFKRVRAPHKGRVIAATLLLEKWPGEETHRGSRLSFPTHTGFFLVVHRGDTVGYDCRDTVRDGLC